MHTESDGYKVNAEQPAGAEPEVAEVLSRVERHLQKWPATKALMEGEYGSVEKAMRALLIGNPELRSEWESGQKDTTALLGQITEIFASQLAFAVDRLADVDRWRDLAATDRDMFHNELEGTLRLYRSYLNCLCGIQSHRPRANEERDTLLHHIKRSKPSFTFGQVANEYKRKTGKTMTAKVAERICNRATTEVEAFLSLETFIPLLKSLPHKTR
jgi:hypothetical protein